MKSSAQLPVALTIAGSDSGGGAGIQADLKTFYALGVHGTSAITCLTAQNPVSVRRIEQVTPEMLLAQLEAVFDEFTPLAVKTGMLGSQRLIGVVAKFFRARYQTQKQTRPCLIVDPVLTATSGRVLLPASALHALTNELFPLATLVTPNLDEAERLLSTRVRSESEMLQACHQFHRQFGCAALVKGGHLRGRRDAVDFFFDGNNETRLAAPFVPGIVTHGTGCTYSAAITAHLALGSPLSEAVKRAKKFITRAIANHRPAGRHDVLNLGGNSLARN